MMLNTVILFQPIETNSDYLRHYYINISNGCSEDPVQDSCSEDAYKGTFVSCFEHVYSYIYPS